MTDENILKKIVLILKQSENYSISVIDSINYLLGNKLEENDSRTLSETMIQDIASSKRIPSQTILNYLAASDD